MAAFCLVLLIYLLISERRECGLINGFYVTFPENGGMCKVC